MIKIALKIFCFISDDENEDSTQTNDDIFENTDVLMMSSICEVTQLVPKLDLSTFNRYNENDKNLTKANPVSDFKTNSPHGDCFTETTKKESNHSKQNQVILNVRYYNKCSFMLQIKRVT